MKPQVPLLPELLDVFKPSGLLAPISSNANIKCHPISSNAIFFNDLSYYDLSAYVIIVYALHYPHMQGSQGNHYYSSGYHCGQQ